jgi:hypothetical protein
MKTQRTIVAFHTGRGGRFNNAGHVTFIGEKNFQDLIQMNDDHLFLQDRKNGKFCKKHYTDLNGTVIVDAEDFNSLVGTLNFDNDYDTDSACYLDECSEEELRIIANSDYWNKEALLEEVGYLIE